MRDTAQRPRDAWLQWTPAWHAAPPFPKFLPVMLTAASPPALGSHARRQHRRLRRRCMACSVGVVLVDHGSRKAESNDMLVHLVSLYKQHTRRKIVHHAHMELACGRGLLTRPCSCLAFLPTHCLASSLAGGAHNSRRVRRVRGRWRDDGGGQPLLPVARKALAGGLTSADSRSRCQAPGRALPRVCAPGPASAHCGGAGEPRPALPRPRGREWPGLRGLHARGGLLLHPHVGGAPAALAEPSIVWNAKTYDL